MKVLIWHDDDYLRVYDATASLELAYQKMFDDMDKSLYWFDPDMSERNAALVKAARTGDRVSAKRICQIAATEGWEYQYSEVLKVE